MHKHLPWIHSIIYKTNCTPCIIFLFIDCICSVTYSPLIPSRYCKYVMDVACFKSPALGECGMAYN